MLISFPTNVEYLSNITIRYCNVCSVVKFWVKAKYVLRGGIYIEDEELMIAGFEIFQVDLGHRQYVREKFKIKDARLPKSMEPFYHSDVLWPPLHINVADLSPSWRHH
jgi:hypothetical protein